MSEFSDHECIHPNNFSLVVGSHNVAVNGFILFHYNTFNKSWFFVLFICVSFLFCFECVLNQIFCGI